MLSARDVKRLDLNSAWRGVPTTQLMENAGAAVAEAARKRYRPRRVLVLCGPGNNGGDGAVAARHLAPHATVTVLYATHPTQTKAEEARQAYERLDRRRVRVETWRSPERTRELLSDADLVIDALLGVGAEGTLREPVASLVRLLIRTRKPVLSVDVPSGLGGRLAVRPAETVTFHDRKAGMTRANSGRTTVRPIGIPAEAETHVGPGDLVAHYRPKAATSHKGQNGRLLIVSGGPYCGAPLLAATAALRMGTDLVRLYTPAECARAAQAAQPDLIVHPGAEARRLSEADADAIDALLPRVDALLIGPGLGNERSVARATHAVMERAARRRVPLILDADALAVAGREPALLRRTPTLATPHAGEFRELTGRKVPHELRQARRVVETQARRLHATLLLKGPTDVISDGRRTRLGDVHHPWMTAGGTGDVLAGIAAALVARGVAPFEAACAAAFVNGAAGLKAFRENSWGARATDLLNAIPQVIRDWIP